MDIQVLREKYGAGDIWLPISPRGVRLDLVLMIDGEHHFKTSSDDTEHQMAVDEAFNDECWRQAHRLELLCSDDKHEWEDCIDLAVTKAEFEPKKKVQLFSSQYATRTAQVNREAIMSHRHNRETGAYFERRRLLAALHNTMSWNGCPCSKFVFESLLACLRAF